MFAFLPDFTFAADFVGRGRGHNPQFRNMKIKIIKSTLGAGDGVTIASPIECMYGGRQLVLGVRQRLDPLTGEAGGWTIYATGADTPDGRIYITAQEWPDIHAAANAMLDGFEAVDPANETDAGKLVAALLKQKVAVQV